VRIRARSIVNGGLIHVSDFGSQAPPVGEQQAPAYGGGQVIYSGRSSGPRAGFWRRFAAAFLDGIIFSILYAVLLQIVSLAVAYTIYLVAYYAYLTILEGGPTGQTLGKRALGIRVIDFGGGGPIGYGRGFLRNIAKILSGLVFGLGYFWMLWDKEKQTWHDKIAGTVVVPIDAYPVR
jgi:uncharacterized RDD family membrane protein YckC